MSNNRHANAAIRKVDEIARQASRKAHADRRAQAKEERAALKQMAKTKRAALKRMARWGLRPISLKMFAWLEGLHDPDGVIAAQLPAAHAYNRRLENGLWEVE